MSFVHYHSATPEAEARDQHIDFNALSFLPFLYFDFAIELGMTMYSSYSRKAMVESLLLFLLTLISESAFAFLTTSLLTSNNATQRLAQIFMIKIGSGVLTRSPVLHAIAPNSPRS